MCSPARKKMLISGVPAWLSVGAKNMERASRSKGVLRRRVNKFPSAPVAQLLQGTASGLDSGMQIDYSHKIITAMIINPICWIREVMLKRSTGSVSANGLVRESKGEG